MKRGGRTLRQIGIKSYGCAMLIEYGRWNLAHKITVDQSNDREIIHRAKDWDVVRNVQRTNRETRGRKQRDLCMLRHPLVHEKLSIERQILGRAERDQRDSLGTPMSTHKFYDLYGFREWIHIQ
jgi:hypothetical protein